jgi:phosphoribosylformylglycinamidine synthase
VIWEVRVSYKRGIQDAEGESARRGLRVLGFKAVEEVTTAKIYQIRGEFGREEIEEMCRRLLANPVSQDYRIREIQE